jgi:tetratricopeptide (TPR) repeat protein
VAALAVLLFSAPVVSHPGIDDQIADLTARIAASPDRSDLYLRRGELYRIHQQWEKAEADYKAALERDANSHTARFCLGRLELESGNAAEAKKLLDDYLAVRATDALAFATRAKANGALGRHLAAAADYSMAIDNNENGSPKPEYYLARARELTATGQQHLGTAIAGLDEGIQRLGSPVTLQLYAIDLEMERKNYDAALVRLDRIAVDSARKEPWLVRKATILEAAGRVSEARLAYEQTLTSLDSLPPTRRNNRAVVRLENEARQALERLGQIETSQ